MDGVLVIDKPAGPTSHDVVAVVRRAIGLDRIGHTGTLDPLATGVLPLVIGRATRLASFLSRSDKEYVARVRFGATTPTYDAEGLSTPAGAQNDAPTALATAHALEQVTIVEALREFTGTFSQMPPPFSAKKIGGTPAYKLARQRKPVELKPVEVTVHEIEVRRYADGLAELRIVCAAGFYVRSLAHDLGQRLGCGAYLDGLQRTRVGDFPLSSATPLDVIVSEGPTAYARFIPLERLMTHLPSVTLSDQGARRVSHGSAVGSSDLMYGERAGEIAVFTATAPGRVRLLDVAGRLLGIAESIDGGLLHPAIVLV